MKTRLERWQRWSGLLLVACLSACSGGASSVGGGITPAGTSPAGRGAAPGYLFPDLMPSSIVTSPGAVNGTDNEYRPVDGDTKSGGHGSTIDNKVPCLPTMSNDYHVHVFLGVILNGTYLAVPDAIGMVKPGPAANGFINTATCFYEIHTHDSSGIVHVEAAVNEPVTAVVYRLRNVLDVWGLKYEPTQFGRWKGPIHVFVGNVPPGTLTVSNYTAFTRPTYWSIPLRSHEVIWIEIGTGYYMPAQLPPVTFYMEY